MPLLNDGRDFTHLGRQHIFKFIEKIDKDFIISTPLCLSKSIILISALFWLVFLVEDYKDSTLV